VTTPSVTGFSVAPNRGVGKVRFNSDITAWFSEHARFVSEVNALGQWAGVTAENISNAEQAVTGAAEQVASDAQAAGQSSEAANQSAQSASESARQAADVVTGVAADVQRSEAAVGVASGHALAARQAADEAKLAHPVTGEHPAVTEMKELIFLGMEDLI
jgi:hypothetical protein